MPGDRRQARIVAMQALCQWEAQQDESPEALDEFLASQEVLGAAAAHASQTVKAFWGQPEPVDRRISDAATKWDLSRISPVERNVMRVAVIEMLGDLVPPKVALNEAIEIGREFGGADSPRFINGVLDVVLKGIQSERKEGG